MMTDDEKPKLLPVSGSFEIEYVNSSGEKSRRIIDVCKFIPNDEDGFVRAFCHRRLAVRTFKYRSITDLVDLESGEVLSPGFFRRILLARYGDAPEREMDIFIRLHRPIIDVLIYIACCDGKYLNSEKRFIAEWLTVVSDMGPEFFNYARECSKTWPVPDYEDFMFSVRAINQQFPDWREAVLEYARGVAEADRRVVREEVKNLELLERLFKTVN